MIYKSAREIFSENLQEALKRSGMEQKDLAKKLGVSPSSVSGWINGEKYPRIDKIQKISEVLNVPQSTLTNDKRKSEQQTTTVETIAAHIDENVTEEQMKDIIKYIEFIKTQDF